MHDIAYVWRSEDTWRKLVLLFYHVGPRDFLLKMNILLTIIEDPIL